MRVVLLLTLVLTSCGKPASEHSSQQAGAKSNSPTTIMLCPQIPGENSQYVMKTPDSVFLINPNVSNFHIKTLFPGEYVTTDGRNCHFSISDDLQVVYE